MSMNTSDPLDPPKGTALITGSSSGIGEAFADLLAEEGFELILTARRLDRLTTLQDRLSGKVSVHTISADLAEPGGPTELYQAIQDKGLQVDILINNAGMMVKQSFTELSQQEIEQTISLNVSALTTLMHQFLPGMLTRKSGRILNVASVAAFHPVPGMDIYAATKAYVLSLTESLSENLKGSGVSVTALCPGLTATEMVDKNLLQVMPPPMISSPEQVAREGFTAMMNRQAISIPGGANKLALTWAQHQPRWLVRSLGGLVAKFQQS